MGKISEALRRVNQERQIQRKLEEERLAEQLKKRRQEAGETLITTEKDEVAKQVSGAQSRDEKRIKEERPLGQKERTLDRIPLKEAIKEKIGILGKDSFFVAKAKDSSGIDSRIVTYHNYSSPISEQYRILRTNIKSLLFKKFSSHKLDNIKSPRGAKIFTVTSSLHSEGKTITCINLAIALAKDLESRVLLIDCDLRNGSIHKFLNEDSNPGLSDVLTDSLDYISALRRTRLENLFVLPRGDAPTNPSELLGSKKMRALIEKLKTELFSYIIIDTPPVIPFTDAGVLGAQTDGTIVVVQANRTKAEVLEKSKELLSQARIKPLGFILTHADYYMPDIYGYYHYYRYHTPSKSRE